MESPEKTPHVYCQIFDQKNRSMKQSKEKALANGIGNIFSHILK